MTNPLFQKDIISISEFTREHIELILKTARQLKENPRDDLLKGRLIGVTFLKVQLVLVYLLKPQFTV